MMLLSLGVVLTTVGPADSVTAEEVLDRYARVASEAEAGDGRATIRYGDYRAVGALKLPHEITVDIGPETHHEYHVDSATTGVSVDDAVFERPSGQVSDAVGTTRSRRAPVHSRAARETRKCRVLVKRRGRDPRPDTSPRRIGRFPVAAGEPNRRG